MIRLSIFIQFHPVASRAQRNLRNPDTYFFLLDFLVLFAAYVCDLVISARAYLRTHAPLRFQYHRAFRARASWYTFHAGHFSSVSEITARLAALFSLTRLFAGKFDIGRFNTIPRPGEGIGGQTSTRGKARAPILNIVHAKITFGRREFIHLSRPPIEQQASPALCVSSCARNPSRSVRDERIKRTFIWEMMRNQRARARARSLARPRTMARGGCCIREKK